MMLYNDVDFLASALTASQPALDHSDFVNKLKANEIQVHIDNDKAGFMYGAKFLMSDKLRTQQALARTIALLTSVTGISLFFFTSWWVATAVLIVGIALSSHAKDLAGKGVLQESVTNSYVYTVAMAKGVLIITSR